MQEQFETKRSLADLPALYIVREPTHLDSYFVLNSSLQKKLKVEHASMTDPNPNQNWLRFSLKVAMIFH